MRLALVPITALALAASLPAAAQDLTITSKVTRDGGQPRTVVSYMTSDRVRMAQGPEGMESIVDLKKGEMISIDGRTRTYFVVTLKDLDALAAQIEKLLNTPEMQSARKAMSQSAANGKGDAAGLFDVTATKTGVTRKIAGYACQEWTLTLGQLSKSEECLSTDLPLPQQTWDAYRGFVDRLKGFMSALGPLAGSASKMEEQMKQMRGFPLSDVTTLTMMGHTSTVSREVTDIRRGPIPDSAWAIPSGFKQVESPFARMLANAGGR